MKAPPPVAMTCGPPSSRRAITRASPERNSASPRIGENLRNGHLRGLFDLRISVDERNPQPQGQRAGRPTIFPPPSCRPARPSAGPAPPGWRRPAALRLSSAPCGMIPQFARSSVCAARRVTRGFSFQAQPLRPLHGSPWYHNIGRGGGINRVSARQLIRGPMRSQFLHSLVRPSSKGGLPCRACCAFSP